MKKELIGLLLLMLLGNGAWAHALWLETASKGELGKEQEIKVMFGEYSYGVTETVDGEAFSKVVHFNVWLTHPNGKKLQLKAIPKGSYYLIKYTPKENGVYTVELDNDSIEVIDYTKYDFGIFKTHYHSTAKFEVGSSISNTVARNNQGLVLQDVSTGKDSLTLRVNYKGTALKEAEVVIAISDNWSKKVFTNEKGEVTLLLPWKTKYLVEVTKKEETPGTYLNDEYAFVWHCATYMIQ